MINDALSSLVYAVENGRTDVLQNVVNTVKKCEENNEGIGLTVSNLFRSECGSYGTILHLAVMKKDRDGVRALLSLGAYPSCRNAAGQTALDLTQDTAMMAVFNEMLLHYIAQGNLKKTEEFLKAGVDVNCLDSDITRNTPLHWAAAYGTTEIAELLIDDSAEVNAQNIEGSTPLHDAVLRSHKDIVQLLVSRGADVSIKAHHGKLQGKSPLEIANGDILPLLTTNRSTKRILPTKPVNGDIKHQLESLDNLPQNGNPAKFVETASGSSSTDTGVTESSVKEALVTNVMTSSFPGSDPKTVQILESLKLLWPTPQTVSLNPSNGCFKAADKLVVAAVNGPIPGMVHDILNAWRAKRQSFLDLHIEFIMETIGYQTSPAVINFDLPSIICQVDPKLFRQAESYKLIVLNHQIRVCASDLAGLHYAVSTFIQLLEIFDSDEAVPCMQIHDWPHFPCRGVLLDFSHGRIPQEGNLWEMIDRLSILKLNEIHLYTRFRLMQSDTDTPDIWQFPYSRSMLIELDRFCHQRFVTLVPVLDVTPAVTYDDLPSVFPVFSDFLSCFNYSKKINIGPRLSSLLIDVNDGGIVTTTNFLPLSDSHLLLICGEALKIGDCSSSLAWLPNNMAIMEYGYTADYDFSPSISKYSHYGASFCVCPGTSAWNSIAGYPGAALQNIHTAIQQGSPSNALGVVVCDWAGKGSITDVLISLPPVIGAAGMAWNSRTNSAPTMAILPDLMNIHLFVDEDRTVGQCIMELGKIEGDLLRTSKNIPAGEWRSIMSDSGSVMFQLLVAPDDLDFSHLSSADFQRALKSIRAMQTQISGARLQCYQGGDQLAAVRLILDLALAACRIGQHIATYGRNPNSADGLPLANIGVGNLPMTAKTDLANRLLALKDVYKSCWLSRHLPIGLAESQSVLFTAVSKLLPHNHSVYQDSNSAAVV